MKMEQYSDVKCVRLESGSVVTGPPVLGVLNADTINETDMYVVFRYSHNRTHRNQWVQ